MTDSIPFTMNVEPSGGNSGCNNGGGFFGNEGLWAVIILAIIFGWGRNGFGGNGGNDGGMSGVLPYVINAGNAQGALTRGDLCQDMNFSDLESGVRGIQQGLCDGFYAMNTGMLNGFHGVDNAICSLGFNMQQGFNSNNVAMMQAQNALATQLADCCCKTQTAIQANTTQGVMNTNAIQSQIQQCCCNAEKDTMQTRFDMAQNNCATLQAIDKVGDRIIDYLAADKAQTLRDENQALRLQASQAAQNQYLVNQLRPCPQPAYLTCNPFTGQSYPGYNGYGFNGFNNNGCGCGCGCNG